MKIVNFAIIGIAFFCSAAAYADCSEMGYEPFLNATTAQQDNSNAKSDKITVTRSDNEKNKIHVATSKKERILLSYTNSQV